MFDPEEMRRIGLYQRLWNEQQYYMRTGNPCSWNFFAKNSMEYLLYGRPRRVRRHV